MKNDRTKVRPMNVHVARGSSAEKTFRARAGLPGAPVVPEVIAPSIKPTPSHDLHFHGGKTLPSLTYTNFYVGGAASWDIADIQNIDSALSNAMSDGNLNNVMAQYFPNQPVSSTFRPSKILPGAAPAIVSQGDIEKMVIDLHRKGQLTGVDLASTVFNFMLPPGTVLNTDEASSHQSVVSQVSREQTRKGRNPAIPHDEDDSLNGLGGYHGSVHVAKTGGGQETIYYAVGVFSEHLGDGTSNGIVVFDKPWKNVVATFYHELNEARTDADVEDAIKAGNDPAAVKFLGWTSKQGEECGDFPVFEANPLSKVFKEVALTSGGGTVPVQFQYSNAVHGPEGPIAAPH